MIYKSSTLDDIYRFKRSRSKLLLTTKRNSSTVTKTTGNQLTFSRTSTLSKLSSNRPTNSQVIAFRTFGSSSVDIQNGRRNFKIGFRSNGSKLSIRDTVTDNLTNHHLNFKFNSINYFQRHFSVLSNNRKQSRIKSTVNDSLQTKQIDKRVLNSKEPVELLDGNDDYLDKKDRKFYESSENEKKFYLNSLQTFKSDHFKHLISKTVNSSKCSKNSYNCFNQLTSTNETRETNDSSNSITTISNSSSSANSQQTSGQQNYTDLINVRSIYRNNLLNQSKQGSLNTMINQPFKPKKALILTKFSRLEYERRKLSGCTEEEVKDNLIRRGSDYESLLNHHKIHTKSKDHVAKTLAEFGIEHRIVNRFEYNQEQIDWADVIITTGGDGTFLMAASKIFNKDKLVIGINSDPSRSVGYLCLQPNYSTNFKPALEKLASGNFSWIYRQRIRISVKGENALDPPAELHDQQLLHPEFRYLDLETHPLNRRSNSPHRSESEFEYQTLPVRALNDVFVGECLSSRVSYFELKVENKPFVKVKSSGMTICTGTGSTSWSFNINKISPQSVSTLFKIINEETNSNLDYTNEQLTKSITKRFNDSLIFDVCRNSMAYTVRDPVYMGNGFDSDNLGFANDIVVKSRMFDACVVIDGGLSYKFNDGSFAKFELLEEDQLKTVAFSQEQNENVF